MSVWAGSTNTRTYIGSFAFPDPLLTFLLPRFGGSCNIPSPQIAKNEAESVSDEEKRYEIQTKRAVQSSELYVGFSDLFSHL